MSAIPIEQLLGFLRVTQNADNAMLQLLLDDAEDEACQYMNRTTLPRRNETIRDDFDSNTRPEPVSDSDDMAPSVRSGIFLVVQAMYEGQTPQVIAGVRAVAEVKWHPYRIELGV